MLLPNAGGDSSSWEAVYRQLPQLKALLGRFTNRAWAERHFDDLLQDCLAGMLKDRASGKLGPDPHLLLPTLVVRLRNAALNLRRKTGRRGKTVQPWPETGAPRNTRNAHSGEALYLCDEIREQCRALLSERQWHVLNAHLDGYSHAEVAQQLDISVANASQLLSRTRRRLRPHLRP